MRKCFKKAIIGLIIILFVSGLIFLIINFLSYRMETKVPAVKNSIEQISEKNKSDLDNIKVDKSTVNTATAIYVMMHQMANTLIVAEDNLIYGEIHINNDSINKSMVIIKDTDLISKEEKEVFLNILQAWKEKNFSQGVQAHNYAWKLLDGNIGRAKELRTEYKK